MNILTKLTVSQLKENKQRTFLTGLSIAVIVSLLTAIAVFVTSFWHFAYNQMVSTSGDWHFQTNLISNVAKSELEKTNFVDSIVSIPASEVTLSPKSYLSVPSDSNNEEMTIKKAKVVVVNKDVEKYATNWYFFNDGQMPKNENEVFVAGNTSDLLNKEITFIVNGIEKTYKVVGTGASKRSNDDEPLIISYDQSLKFDTQYVFMKTSQLNNSIFKIVKDYSKSTNKTVEFISKNTSLLALNLVSENMEIYAGIGGLILVVISIVAIIAVAVISSSFMLSLNERLKQLGALSSVGTTKKQIRKMMLLESIIIGSISIVTGVVIGIIGIGITLIVINDLIYSGNLLTDMSSKDISLSLYIDWRIIILIVVLSLIILLISAFAPVVRAAKRAPIDNIKQVPFKQLLKFSRKKEKTGKKQFGISHYLAHRYQKHNKSRSRTVFTVLTLSLMTFITIANLLSTAQSNITLLLSPITPGTVYSRSNMVLYADSIFYKKANSEDGKIPYSEKQKWVNEIETTLNKTANIQSHYVVERFNAKAKGTNYFDGVMNITGDFYLDIVTVSQTQEEELLKVANISKEEFEQKGILVTYDYRTSEKGKYNAVSVAERIFNNEEIQLINVDQSQTNLNSIKIATNINGKQLSYGLFDSNTLVVSKKQMEVFRQKDVATTIEFVLNTNGEDNINITKALKEVFPSAVVNDAYTELKSVKNILMIIQILIYGFLSLISIVCVTTLFNMMSSHIRLRRREFAILRSIGMTTKQIKLMLTIENLKAGGISILVATVLSYIITSSTQGSFLNNIIQTEFNYPLMPTIISGGLLLIILIVFNLFAIRSTLKRSLVEDIRNEVL